MTNNGIIQDAKIYSESLEVSPEVEDVAFYAYVEGCKRQLYHDTKMYMEVDRLIRRYEEMLSRFDDPDAEKVDEFRTKIDRHGRPRLPHTYEKYTKTVGVRGVRLKGVYLRKLITANFGRNMNWMQSYLENEEGAVKYCVYNWESIVYEQVMGKKKLRLEYKELRLGKTMFEELLSRVEDVRTFMLEYLEKNGDIPSQEEYEEKMKNKNK